ncbi:NlpC/P60 family protein [Tropicimonas sp. IMCC6043]|uniref:NlpC/P60 family protein n=1 Tax=Tropicimonas sp. IMCC6043 TaxID=2510645 RepID=UPI00101D4FC2|nr:NlpC/P60 family protein [Tropicimonas sp. IMCC6043]RYH11176.1 peptidase [Tropicimonas sp. IMCC6043]
MRERVMEIARDWIGTPYCHQASVKGVGTDCLGLVRGVWRELFGAEPETVPGYSADWSEASGEERLWQAAMRHLLQRDPSESPEPGDVLLFRMRQGSVAKHLGIFSVRELLPSVIHAYQGHAVIESPLSQPLRQRIVARFEFPEGYD